VNGFIFHAFGVPETSTRPQMLRLRHAEVREEVTPLPAIKLDGDLFMVMPVFFFSVVLHEVMVMNGISLWCQTWKIHLDFQLPGVVSSFW